MYPKTHTNSSVTLWGIFGLIIAIEGRNSTVVKMTVSICMGYASSPLLMVVEVSLKELDVYIIITKIWQ